MARYKVIVAYDGTSYKGFQRQAKATTIQGELETALQSIGWAGSSIYAAGRTDTGVHAVGQVIAFDLNWRHAEQDLLNAINANLPQSIAARDVKQVSPGFHPRYDARSRQYHYHIVVDPIRNPQAERFALRLPKMPDIEQMQTAAGDLIGQHDFAAFGSPPVKGGSTVRTIIQAEWSVIAVEPVPEVLFEITADAFLYRMVRRIAGVLISIGLHQVEPDVVKDHLAAGAANPVLGLIPPNGLFLWQVDYPEEIRN